MEKEIAEIWKKEGKKLTHPSIYYAADRDDSKYYVFRDFLKEVTIKDVDMGAVDSEIEVHKLNKMQNQIFDKLVDLV